MAEGSRAYGTEVRSFQPFLVRILCKSRSLTWKPSSLSVASMFLAETLASHNSLIRATRAWFLLAGCHRDGNPHRRNTVWKVRLLWKSRQQAYCAFCPYAAWFERL